MSESPGPAGMDMETVLTRAVKKFFKWQLTGLSGTLIVAAMLWFLVFFFFFLILVFVMCVEYHYDKRERQDAELALPKDEEKKWAGSRTSRETSKTSLKRVAPIPMPPLPVTKDEPKAVFVSETELEPEAEPLARQEESPTEAITEESVIVDAPADEAATRSPSPPQAVEEPEPEESPEADEEQPPPVEEEEAVENTQEEADDTVEIGGDDNDDAAEPESEEPPQPETETQEGDNTVAEAGEGEGGDDEDPDASTVPPEETVADNANPDVGSPSKASIHSKKGED